MTFFNYMIWWLINQININELQTSIYEIPQNKNITKSGFRSLHTTIQKFGGGKII